MCGKSSLRGRMPLLSFPARNLISDKKLSATISTLYYTNCNHNLTNICQRKDKCGKNRETNLGGAIEAGFSGPWRDGGGNTDIEEVRWLEGGLQEIIRGGFAKGNTGHGGSHTRKLWVHTKGIMRPRKTEKQCSHLIRTKACVGPAGCSCRWPCEAGWGSRWRASTPSLTWCSRCPSCWLAPRRAV